MARRLVLALVLSALAVAPAAGAAPSLPRGKYPCYGVSGYLNFDIVVTGPGAYATSGRSTPARRGAYALRGSRIVFSSGPLKGFNARLFEGAKIGMNKDGSSFYSTNCTLTP